MEMQGVIPIPPATSTSSRYLSYCLRRSDGGSTGGKQFHPHLIRNTRSTALSHRIHLERKDQAWVEGDRHGTPTFPRRILRATRGVI